MRDFRRPSGALGKMPVSTRLIYTTYLIFALAAFTVAFLLYQAGPSLETSRAAKYYAGGEVPVTAEKYGGDPAVDATPKQPAAPKHAPGDGAADEGPALDLGGMGDPLDATAQPATGEADAMPSTEMRPPMNRKRLIEITHGHLFMMPLVWLIIAHLFALTGLPRWFVGAMVATGAVSVAAHLVAPWLIRDVSTAWTVLLPASGIGMTVSLGGMALLSLILMWLPGASHPRRKSSRNSKG